MCKKISMRRSFHFARRFRSMRQSRTGAVVTATYASYGWRKN